MKIKQPSLIQSLTPVVILMFILLINVVYTFGDNALGGANQFALLIGAVIAAGIGVSLNFKWDDIMDGVVESLKTAIPAILILLMIGALAGSWMMSGIVPAMVYYGLDILHPKIFLFAACIISAIVSLASGSSWSTVATVGIALFSIGKIMGLHDGMVAGAIISGAYFGDKLSPLSDTTNLAPAMAGTDLITHINYMLYTTIPSFVITLLIFLVVGFWGAGEINSNEIIEIQNALTEKFNLTPLLFFVPIAVIFLIVKKVPSLPSIMAGVALGVLFMFLFQGDIITQKGEEINEQIRLENINLAKEGVKPKPLKNQYELDYMITITSLTSSISIDSDNEVARELLSTSGMEGMLNTIWLIICAMVFGGVMEATGMLKRITKSLLKLAKSDGSLVAATSASCIVTNATASDQYLSIVIPGKMFKKAFDAKGLSPENLSRTLEDSGTVTSVLFPWNTCSAYHAGVLGIASGEFIFYCFFNIISPIMTTLFAFLSVKIKRIKKIK